MCSIDWYVPYLCRLICAENDPYRKHFSSVDSTKYTSSWFAVSQAVRVALGESTQPEFTGKIIELSASGVRLRTDRKLTLGSAVVLSWNGTALSAEVRRCMAAKSGFLVECRLQSVGRTNQRAAAANTK
jgi:hypothetical protein